MPTSPRPTQSSEMNDLATNKLPPVSYTIDYIEGMAERVQSVVNDVRTRVFLPSAEKVSPVFSLTQVAALCGVDKNAINRRLMKADDNLPKGTPINAARREFTLAETQEWVRAYKPPYRRSPSTPATVIAVGNFKGGVAKTTSTVCISQALSLKGYKVLLIDFDPQGSATSLMGVSPETEVQPEDTFYPLVALAERESESQPIKPLRESLRPSIRKTYWHGVDLVPAAPVLFNADFFLPYRQSIDPSFQFWNRLNEALDFDGIRKEYDYVLIDTPPSLSYMTLNAFFAADGLLVPVPPEGPDFASSAQFWSLFAGLGQVCDQHNQPKQYSWIRVLPTIVNRSSSKPQTGALLEWIHKAYGTEVMPVEIPDNAAVSFAGTSFGTVYDISKYVGSAKTYSKVRDAYDALADRIDDLSRVYKWRATN